MKSAVALLVVCLSAIKKAATFLLSLLATSGFVSGASFVNLGFDSANLPSIPFGQYGAEVPISQALPGWNGFLGTNLAETVLHNNVTLGSAAVCIWGPDQPYGVVRIEGAYTVRLLPGGYTVGGPVSLVDVSISQTGDVPANALSLMFKASLTGTSAWATAFSVYANNTPLSLTPLLVATNYTLFGADVSAFAGHQTELKFTDFFLVSDHRSLMLDSITFSPQSIPEPSVLGLVACGGVFFLISRRRRRLLE